MSPDGAGTRMVGRLAAVFAAVAVVTSSCGSTTPVVGSPPSRVPAPATIVVGASPARVPAPLGCRGDDIRSQIGSFFRAVGNGDRAALDALLSPAFRDYAIGAPEPSVVAGREETIAYFIERSRRGERFTLVDIAVSPYLEDGKVGFQLRARRQIDQLAFEYDGKGAVYCGTANAHGIIVLVFGNANQPSR